MSDKQVKCLKVSVSYVCEDGREIGPVDVILSLPYTPEGQVVLPTEETRMEKERPKIGRAQKNQLKVALAKSIAASLGREFAHGSLNMNITSERLAEKVLNKVL